MIHKDPNIAILSPTKDAYSETFISEQKKRLNGNIFFYYGIFTKKKLEGYGHLHRSRKSFFYKLQKKVLRKSNYWLSEKFLRDSLIDNKIEVVLAQYGDHANLHLSIVKELNLPLIVHFHGYDASIREIIEKNDKYKEVFEYCQYVVAVSKQMYEKLLKLGCPEEKLIYNVYGPREEFFNVEPLFSKQQFLAVGRFVEKKAPYYLIISFMKVVKKFPTATLVMAGEGSLLETCKRISKALGMNENIQFPGVIDAGSFKQYLSESVAFVQHSVTAANGDSEGTPLAVLEASLAGLPVLSTKHAGIGDVVVNEKTGLLVDEHDVSSMTSNMLKILQDKKLAKKMGQCGKRHIKNKYNIEKYIGTLDELIFNVLRKNE